MVRAVASNLALTALGAVWAALALTPLRADTRVKSLGKTHQGPCPIAIDPLGLPHVAFQSSDYHLHHTWFDGRRWRKELVDGTSDCGWWSSIAVSPVGDVHISYFAERRDPVRGRLAHALFRNGTWRLTDLDTSGRSTRLALDAAGRPHILHENDTGRLGYARFDGAAWSIEDTGLGSSPYTTGLALDGEGHAHVSYLVSAFMQVAESSAQIALHASLAEDRRSLTLIDLKNAGYHTSLALDASGIAHGTYLRGSRDSSALLMQVRIALPDLLVTWEGASATEVKGGTRITGRLNTAAVLIAQ